MAKKQKPIVSLPDGDTVIELSRARLPEAHKRSPSYCRIRIPVLQQRNLRYDPDEVQNTTIMHKEIIVVYVLSINRKGKFCWEIDSISS